MLYEESSGAVATKELISYAVLTANYNQKPDSSYLENFEEFVSYALATGDRGIPMTAGQVAGKISDDFGLVIPTKVIQKILTRGWRKKDYERIGVGRAHTFGISEAHR